MLEELYNHFDYQVKHGGIHQSLIAKIYGIYTVKLQGLRAISLFIMKNSIMITNPKNQINLKFDLKGSKVKRRVLPRDIYSFTER